MRNPTAYLKMRVLGAVDMAEGATERARLQAVSQMIFTDEDGLPRQFTWRTISTWLCRYRKHGVTVMEKQTRSDKGKPRKVRPEDILEAIQAARPKTHGRAPKRSVLYRLCIEQGLLLRSQVARTTFYRLIREFELLKPDADAANKVRLAFAKAHANEMWQADTLCGPFVKINGVPVQTRLIAFLDDASRLCCHGQFFPTENVDTLIESLRAAVYKRRVPHALYVDNGSIYTSKEIIQICARVGCLLHHTPVRDGAANRQFTQWVEEHYNAQVHSVLGLSPLDRFALDRKWVRFLPPNEANDELFFVEAERHVRADNTFAFKSLRWEAPRHLPDRTIQIRFQRSQSAARVVVYYKGERMGEARLLNPVANDRKPLHPPATEI
ncbi:MAG: transposase family protein [Verrucomicrobiae bacterium]|nr:transposase family protein [Verrucomicrobiae bacterium]